MFRNRITKSAIIKNWGIKTRNGYYLLPRKRSLPYAGWVAHHKKEETKINPAEHTLFESGSLPKEAETDKDGKGYVVRSAEEKKRKAADILIEMRQLIQDGHDEEAWTKFPRMFLQYGEKIKAMIHQKRKNLLSEGDPHLWVHGPPGIGKSAVLNMVYPNYYKKNLFNRFFDLYDPKEHSHVLLEDLDHDAVDKLSVNFIKTLCDEEGFAVDQKYKTPQLSRASILVTSNFSIDEVVDHSDHTNTNSMAQNKAALYRRFWHINIYKLLELLGIKLIPTYEINLLKKAGNNDPSKLFYTWDYVMDCPACSPLKSPEMYKKLIKNAYYSK
jgi:hypothetical protein